MPPDDSRFDRLGRRRVERNGAARTAGRLGPRAGRLAALRPGVPRSPVLAAGTWRDRHSAHADCNHSSRVRCSPRAPWLSRSGTPLAIAASLLVAVWAGTALQRAQHWTRSAGRFGRDWRDGREHRQSIRRDAGCCRTDSGYFGSVADSDGFVAVRRKGCERFVRDARRRTKQPRSAVAAKHAARPFPITCCRPSIARAMKSNSSGNWFPSD